MAKRKGPKWEEILARFQAKIESIPPELRLFVSEYMCYRATQDQRKAWANRLLAATKEGGKVAWASVFSAVEREGLAKEFAPIAKALEHVEGTWQYRLEKIKDTSWFQEVIVPASRGYCGANTACAILVHIGDPSRFATVGKLWKYCGLDVRGGHAPSLLRMKGEEAPYCTPLLTALYMLSETWNRSSKRVPILDLNGEPVRDESGKALAQYVRDDNCVWRDAWEQMKDQERARRPGERPAFYHNKARRKLLRKFMSEVWKRWLQWQVEHEAAA